MDLGQAHNVVPLRTFVLSAAMAKEDNIAFLDDILFPFEADLSFFLCSGNAARGEEVFAANDFGANEALFDVAVNFTRGFDGSGAFANGPGANFRLARGEKREQTHEVVGCANQAVEARLLQAVGGQQLRGFLVVHFGKFGFETAADSHNRGVGAALQGSELVFRDRLVHFGGFFIAKIQDVEHGALGQKEEAANGFAFFGGKLKFTKRFFGFEMRFTLFKDTLFVFQNRILLFLEVLFNALKAFADLVVVGEDEFQVEVGGVAKRIDTTLGVRDRGIVEDADHVSDGVDVAERGEAFAHAFFLDAGKIDVLNGGVGDFLGVIEFGELREPGLGNLGHANVRGLRALGVHVSFGEDAEESSFSDLRQSNNSCLHK
jgi:hypothetical protein